MKQYKAVFIDWDDTIGDFVGAAKLALQDMYEKYNLSDYFASHEEFVSLYKQNLVKGGPDFPRTLAEMATAAWTDRKNSARTQGELAEQKLLLPTMFMFVGILLMIIVPAFRNLF